MNRDEITAKIAELEKKIQMDKLQKWCIQHRKCCGICRAWSEG